jgi:hypothetical protein
MTSGRVEVTGEELCSISCKVWIVLASTAKIEDL